MVMRRTKNITMIAILIVSLGLAVLFVWLFLSVLKSNNEINYAEYSDCLLYSDHSKQKIDLTRHNNSQLVSATFKNLAQTTSEVRQLSANEWAFIDRCENNMLYQADAKIVAAFNQKKAVIQFNTIADVVNGLTNNKFYPYQLEEMVLALDDKEQLPFRNNLISFANLFVNIFGASVFKKLIYNLEIDNSIAKYDAAYNNWVIAITKLKENGNDLAQCLMFTEHSLQAQMSKVQYQIGFHSTATNISTFVHEIGYAISNYAWVWPNNRLRFNHNDSTNNLAL